MSSCIRIWKEKTAKKITEFHCIVLFQSQQEGFQHSEPTYFLFFLSRSLRKKSRKLSSPEESWSRPYMQLLSGHNLGVSWAEGLRQGPGWCLLSSHQLTWPGRTKISLTRWGRGEPPGNQGRLEKHETGDRASWPIFLNEFIWRFG